MNRFTITRIVFLAGSIDSDYLGLLVVDCAARYCLSSKKLSSSVRETGWYISLRVKVLGELWGWLKEDWLGFGRGMPPNLLIRIQYN